MPQPAEYKQVTALFADVVRSATIAASVDIERLREIMTEIVERSAAVAQHYGGTVEYNGDGVMALFGAPVALEDHAFRACLAALAIQEDVDRLAAELQRRDNLALQLRIGLNSGRVIAGKVGSGSLGYRATGEPVVLAQRMESAAPPGGVMLSESTARLVDHMTELSEPEWVRVKGVDEPVCARRLLAISPRAHLSGRAEAELVGRRWEMAALEANLDRAIRGHGGLVHLVGPPGIGKSRVARELSSLANDLGVEVFWAFCESHASDMPFYVVAQLLRAVFGVANLDVAAARTQVRTLVPGADEEDLRLLDDLIGIADPDVALPQVDPDARRRRLIALMNTASLERTKPALVIIEDAHWIDVVSESMLAGFLSVIASTPSMTLITARPEYQGLLTRIPGAQTIALAPLVDSATADLVDELVGPDPSVAELAAMIADRAGGNPFFAEEMVRELAQRGVLTGQLGNYVCRSDVGDIAVPGTVQAAIEARIDRLSAQAKQTLNAAAVIGARFDAELLTGIGVDPVMDELLGAYLVDQVRFSPVPEYAFHHPLIHAVAYESQLISDRAEWHRRLAAAIQQRVPESLEENAALIAEHLESAAVPRAAYDWHMRAAAWLTNRDVGAARQSWERARGIADRLPDDDPDKLAMRIAPRTMLSVTDFHAPAVHESQGRFAELRELCSAANDKVSLAIGMTGLASELLYSGRGSEAARLASEQMVLLESIGDPTLTIGLGFVAFACWYDQGAFEQILAWSQTIIDLSRGDSTQGAGFGFGSPLAAALAFRGVARWWLGRPGWRKDLGDAVAIARGGDPTTFAYILAWTYSLEIAYGVRRPDDAAVGVIEEAAEAAGKTSNDNALTLVEYCLGVPLVFRDAPDDRQRGLELLIRVLGMLRERVPSLVPVTEVWVAARQAKGDRDAALPLMRHAVDELLRSGRVGYSVAATGELVQTLLELGSESDLREAREMIERMESLRSEHDSTILEITLLRLHALLTRARGDFDVHRDLALRYRAMAELHGFEGHLDWAQAMIEDRGANA